MSNLHKVVLSILLTTSISFATSISTTKATYYDSNMQHVAVNINGELSNDRDWVGIYKKGDNNDWDNVVAWSWVEGKKSNLHMNTKRTIDENHAARYEARLFFHNSYKVEARAPFVYIPMSPPPSNFPRFPIDTFNPMLNEGAKAKDIGISLNVEISGNKDWIGIYKKGDNNNWDNVIDWAPVEKNGAVGTFKRDVKLSKGEYNIRLFFNNSYDVEWSNNFTVVGATTPPIKTLKDTYNVNETISVTVEQSQLTGADDRIGVYRKSDKQEWDWDVVLKWAWTPVSRTYQLTEGDKPLPAGEYEIRLYTDFDSNTKPKAKYSFRIVDSAGNGNKKYPKTIQLKDVKDPRDFPADKPEKGETIVNNDLDTKTMQISKSDNNRSPYPKVQAWNADMSLLRIKYKLYDAKTYKETDFTKNKGGSSSPFCSANAEYMRWSNKKPKEFYLTRATPVDKNIPTFVKGVINGNDRDCHIIRRFYGYEKVYMTLEEGNIANNEHIAMIGKKKNDSKIYVIMYDIEHNVTKWEKELKVNDPEFTWPEGSSLPNHFDWITLSPSGKYIVLNTAHKKGDDWTGGGIFVYKYTDNKNEALENPVQLTIKNNQNEIVSVYGEHGDIGVDSNGNEVWVMFMIDKKGHNDKKGIYIFNLAKANQPGEAVISSTDFNKGGHISCRNIKRPGWCYVSPYELRYGYMFAVKLKALKDAKNDSEKENVQLFSQGYFKEKDNYLYGGVSPDGTKVIFNEYISKDNWNTFVAEVK